MPKKKKKAEKTTLQRSTARCFAPSFVQISIYTHIPTLYCVCVCIFMALTISPKYVSVCVCVRCILIHTHFQFVYKALREEEQRQQLSRALFNLQRKRETETESEQRYQDEIQNLRVTTFLIVLKLLQNTIHIKETR